jgi:hypothetical protein
MRRPVTEASGKRAEGNDYDYGQFRSADCRAVEIPVYNDQIDKNGINALK